jgi:hypothetical protein
MPDGDSMTNSEFDELLAESFACLQSAIDSCNAEWDIQSYQQWDLYQDERVLVFSEGPRPDIECEVQVVGTWLESKKLWRWAWDNDSIDEPLKNELTQVREFGEAQGVPALSAAAWEADDQQAAWAMTAIAAKLLGGISAYRGPAGELYVFMVIKSIRPRQHQEQEA